MNMKNEILVFFLGVVAGCSDPKSSITGLYVLDFHSNDRKETDTIVITPLNEKAHVYYFVHHIECHNYFILFSCTNAIPLNGEPEPPSILSGNPTNQNS